MNLKPDRPEFYVGLMSGTSGDGIDAALCTFSGDGEQLTYHLVGALTEPFPAEMANALRTSAGAEASELSTLNVQLGRCAAGAVQRLLDREEVDPGRVRVIGSHGHTVCHVPDGTPSSTFQIGEEAVIAERTGIPVIGDFRAADVAAGGEGAPLIPRADWLLWRKPGSDRVLVNLGGFVNPTFLPAEGVLGDVVAFDSGPGNVLLDGLARRTEIGPYDPDGAQAAQGTPAPEAVERALSHPYFDRSPPRSTGRNTFGKEWMADWLEQMPSDASAEDLLATGTRIVARHLADSLESDLPAVPDQLILAGGGRHNRTLVSEIRQQGPDKANVRMAEEVGIDGDAREAVAFALFAYLAEHEQTGNVPAATGARHPVRAGKRTPPSGRPYAPPTQNA